MKIAMIGVKGISVSEGGGGIENFVQQIGVRLAKRGHDIYVYTRSFYEKLNGNYNGIKLIQLPSVNTKHLDTFTHSAISSFNGLFRSFDIIHFHGIGIAIFSLLPRLVGSKSILHIHAPDWLMKKWGLFAKIYLKSCNYPAVHFPNKVAVVSKTLKKYYMDKFGLKTYYIPGGIHKCTYRYPKKILSYGLKERNFILYSAGLRQQKGCHYLIQAYNKLNTNIKLAIPGGSRYADEYILHLKKLAKGNPNIIFLGFADSETMEELYSNAYIYVLPSEVEGLSQALQQAMGYGNCIVASNIPPNLEVLQTHGYFFKNKDYKDLYDILQMLLSNPSMTESKRESVKEHVFSKYNWDNIVISLENFYKEVLDSK